MAGLRTVTTRTTPLSPSRPACAKPCAASDALGCRLLGSTRRGAHLLRPRSRVLANGAAGADPDRLTLSCAILLVPDDKRNWRIIPPAVLAVVTASGERPRSWTEPRISRARRFAEDSPLEGRGFEPSVPLPRLSSIRAVRAEIIGRSTDVFRRDRETDVSALQGRPTISGGCSPSR